jgi:M6 family metalloprotease-like protein
VISPWSPASGAATHSPNVMLAPGTPGVAIPQAWIEAQAQRAKRWRSFPDLVLDPSLKWEPHFADRRGVDAPLRNTKSASPALAGPGGRGLAAPTVMKVALIRIEFEHDRGGDASTGNGRFDLSDPGSSVPAVDRPPHNRKFYQDHMEALRRYYVAQSYGTVEIQAEVWPRSNSPDTVAYRVSDMADYGPWAFGSSIYPAAVKMFHDFLIAADTTSKKWGDPIPWRDYYNADTDTYQILVIHAGSDLQSDVRQDSPEDIPTFTLGVADTDRVVFPGTVAGDCAPVAGDTLAQYCPVRNALFLPEHVNQDGFFGTINAVVAHECGHLLFGLSDLYDIVNGLPVVGFWSLMDTGNLAGATIPQDVGEPIFAVGLLPPSIDPFQRFFVGKALSFPEVTYDGAPTRILDGERHPDMRSVTLGSDEFLLLENRAIAAGDTLVLAQDLTSHVILGPQFPDSLEYDSLLPTWPKGHPYEGKPAGGIVVWHVDTSVLTYSTSLRVNEDFGFNTNHRRLGVSVIEADGLEDLGDLGSPLLFGSYRDPYYVTNNMTLSDTTIPSLIPNVKTRPHVRLDFLDLPNDTMLFEARRTWQLPGWPVTANEFPPGGPQLLAADVDGDAAQDLEVCWAGGDTLGTNANGIFVLKRNGQGLLGPEALLTTLPDRPRPLLAAVPRGAGLRGDEGPSYLAVSTYSVGTTGGQVWLIDGDINNAGQPVAGWPVTLPSPVSTPPIIVGSYPNAFVLVGCENGNVYALGLDGTVRASSTFALPGGIRGRLAAWQNAPGSWAVAAGGGGGAVVVWGASLGPGPPEALYPVAGWPRSLVSYAGFAPDFLWLDFDGAGGAGGNPSGCNVSTPELVVHDRNRLWAFCSEGRLLPGWGREGDTLVVALGAGDPDGDGFPEVLTQTLDSKVAFVNSSGYPSPGWPKAGSTEGVLQENPELNAPGKAERFPTQSPPLALDLDGDTRSEVVAPNTSGILAALDAQGHTPAGWPLATGSGARGSAVAADLDHDGYLELIAPDRFGMLFAYSLPVPSSPESNHPWRMLGGDPGRTSSLPISRMENAPAASAGPLIHGSLKAYPNPARRRPISFAYQLSEPADVEFRILDASGHQVASFARSGQRADNLEVWEPGDLPAGLYLARLRFRAAGREEVQVLPVGLIR